MEQLFILYEISTTKLKILKIFKKVKFLLKKSKNLGKIVKKISQTVGISCAREANEQFFVSETIGLFVFQHVATIGYVLSKMGR